MRAMRDLQLVDYSWYLHEYEASQVAELFSREKLRLHGLFEHIDGEWASRYIDAVWRDLIRLQERSQLLVLGFYQRITWRPR
jgi:hypothetical protein